MKVGFLLFVSVSILIVSWSINDVDTSTQDDKSIKSIKIGEQEWMLEDLDVSTFRNGDEIPYYASGGMFEPLVHPWKKGIKKGSPMSGRNHKKSKNSKVYSWNTINDPRGLAPLGWHIPSKQEWETLVDYLGGKDVAGGKMRNYGRWMNDTIDSFNSSGFSANPNYFCSSTGHYNLSGSGTYTVVVSPSSGQSDARENAYRDSRFHGHWWSTTEDDQLKHRKTGESIKGNHIFKLQYQSDGSDFIGLPLTYGFAVRCIKD